MRVLLWWIKKEASSCLKMRTYGKKETGASLPYGSKEEKMRMPVKVFRKHALCWKGSQKLLAAEEGRSNIPSCTQGLMSGPTQGPPIVGWGCIWAWWSLRKAAEYGVPKRTESGKKGKCLFLMTLSSTKCGRMLKVIAWYSLWMCGTLS